MAPLANCPETLFAQLLLAGEEPFGSRIALRTGEHAWTYDQLRRAVQSTSYSLAELGVKRGERVLMVLPNSPEFVVAFLAVTALGAIAVPVDFQAGPERLRFIAQDTAPTCCLYSKDKKLPDEFAIAKHAFQVMPSGEGIHLSDLASPDDISAGSLPAITADADAVILFSAGSTGRPKGAVLKHRHLLRIAQTLVGIVGMGPDHRELILSPMTHSGGWQRVTSTLLARGCVVIPQGPFSVPALLEDVRENKIHAFFAAPPILRVLMMTDARRVREATTSLRSIESASAPLSPDELSKLMNLLPRVRVLWQYGLTECSRALILDTRAHPNKLHTVGVPTPGVEISIADSDGKTLGPGEKGEVRLRAPQRTEHYWNRPDLNRERFHGSWLLTGDVGSIDEDGFLTYHGRRDDMINCGGLSYFPAEVERELGPVPGVVEYLVAGVPDRSGLLGQVPWVFVVPEKPDCWSPTELAACARARLPAHMLPRRIVQIPSIPMIRAGKPDRRRVIATYGPESAAELSPGDEARG